MVLVVETCKYHSREKRRMALLQRPVGTTADQRGITILYRTALCQTPAQTAFSKPASADSSSYLKAIRAGVGWVWLGRLASHPRLDAEAFYLFFVDGKHRLGSHFTFAIHVRWLPFYFCYPCQVAAQYELFGLKDTQGFTSHSFRPRKAFLLDKNLVPGYVFLDKCCIRLIS